MKLRILLADDDEKLLKKAKDYFSAHINYKVVGEVSNGADAVRQYDTLKPDITVLDLVMPVKDGISVLEEINKGSGKIIAVSSVDTEEYAKTALQKGADYFLLKPFTMEELERKMEVITSRKVATKPYRPMSATERKITDIFMTVGIPAHIKGYQFLREAIKMAIDSPDIVNSITKRLYPEVAERFDTSPSKVERAIRHAIEVAWNKGKIENINSLFGVRIYSPSEKPTNGEFIALVADKMLLESV